MALRGFWGFDHEASPQQILDTVPGATGNCTFSSTTPYGEGRCIALTLTGYYFSFPFDAQQTWIEGFHYRPNIPALTTIARFQDGSTTQIRIQQNSTGYLEVVHGSGAILAVGPYIGDPPYKHIQFKATIDAVAGAFEVRVNNTTVLSASGIDTQQSANPYADTLYFGHGGANDLYLDNLWICDGSGADFNDCLGELRVITRRPNAPGNYTQWTPNTGANWECVDDEQPDNDTTYVSSLVIGNKDSFPLVALGVDSGVILAVNRNIRPRKDDVEQREIAMLTRQDAADYEGSNLALLAGYKNFREQLLTCPDATEWTREKFAAMQWGYNYKV